MHTTQRWETRVNKDHPQDYQMKLEAQTQTLAGQNQTTLQDPEN